MGEISLESERDVTFLFHPKFQEGIDKLEKVKQEAVKKKLEKFKKNPEHFSYPYTGKLSGNRKIKVLSDLRILITLCWKCRELGFEDKHSCIDCEDIEDDTVICWVVGSHKDVDRKKNIVTKPWKI